MKIYTKIVWDIETGKLLHEESFGNYTGPVALCDRAQEKKVVNQGLAQSSTDQANAQTSFGNTNTAVQGQQQATKNFLNFGRQTYGEGGTFQRSQNTLNTTAAAAGARGIGGNLILNAARTGQNTASYAPTLAEASRQGRRDVTDRMATADQSRLAALSKVQETALDASKFPAQVHGQLYGAGTQGAASNLGVAAGAAKTPGFWDTFGTAYAAAQGKGLGSASSSD